MNENYYEDGEGIPTLGDVQDELMRAMNPMDLNDFYIGSRMAPPNTLEMYFSEAAPEDDLDALTNNVEAPGYIITVTPSNAYGAGYLFLVEEEKSAQDGPIEGTVAELDGSMSHEVPIDGLITVA
jgi:hypothetical protein